MWVYLRETQTDFWVLGNGLEAVYLSVLEDQDQYFECYPVLSGVLGLSVLRNEYSPREIVDCGKQVEIGLCEVHGGL